MDRIKATGISDGLAIAKLKVIKRSADDKKARVFLGADKELECFKTAQQDAMEQLDILADKARNDVGDDMALLFETHRMMAEDPDFEDLVETNIKENHMTADEATEKAGEELSAVLSNMDDEYMKGRAADVKDVARRIKGIITGEGEDDFTFTEPVILAADDLSPSETLRLDKNFVMGFILSNGTVNGHTGILARSMGIPALIRPEAEITEAMNGKTVYIDGKDGVLILEPDGDTLDMCMNKISEYKETKEKLLKYRQGPTVTLDGRKIKLYCNIGSCDETDTVLENGGEGIGLFRSEFLYLKGDDYPTEEEQFAAYKKTLEAMKGKEVIIRTCDIGSDKKIGYFDLPDEENPALGTRAIRLCFIRKERFKEQLRALYRASAFGKLSIMLPMIASKWEIDETKELAEEVKRELKAEGKAYDENVRFGIMIETPAAAVISDELAKEVDFFSIGSNDLTQYTLACDRNGNLGRHFDPHHPAVLRLIKTVAENAHKAGIEVGICGELGADETLTEFFLEIGIDELSISPKKVPVLRKRISEI